MADTHGHDKDDHHDSHDAALEEDVVRTPLWLPFVGLGLLMVGALSTYLWVYPGTMSASATGDAATGDASAEAGAPSGGGNAQPQPMVVPVAPAH